MDNQLVCGVWRRFFHSWAEVQILYYQIGKAHFVEQTCSTDYYRVFRCAEEGQISDFDPLPRKIRCRSGSARKKSPNTENIDITMDIRPDTWKFSFRIAPLESASAMGFSVRITETETGNNLFPQ